MPKSEPLPGGGFGQFGQSGSGPAGSTGCIKPIVPTAIQILRNAPRVRSDDPPQLAVQLLAEQPSFRGDFAQDPDDALPPLV